jgi:hypothetical protein
MKQYNAGNRNAAMIRRQVLITRKQNEKLLADARHSGISVNEIIRRALDLYHGKRFSKQQDVPVGSEDN